VAKRQGNGTATARPRRAARAAATEKPDEDGRPEVVLGRLAARGIAPSLLGLVEHGVNRRPKVAKRMRGRVVIRFEEDFAPVRITFRANSIVVEDGDSRKPDLEIIGSLPDIVHFAAAPSVRGIPNPARARGRRAISRVARRHVRVSGDGRLARGLLQLLAL
jgi:hypothetical protein